jgi:hypothetical protein
VALDLVKKFIVSMLVKKFPALWNLETHNRVHKSLPTDPTLSKACITHQGNTGTVPRAYDIFRPTKQWKGEKIKN